MQIKQVLFTCFMSTNRGIEGNRGSQRQHARIRNKILLGIIPFLQSALFLSTLDCFCYICGPCFVGWHKQRIYRCLYNNIVYYFNYTLCATPLNTIVSLISESITKIHLTIVNPQFRWCCFSLVVCLQ